MRYIGLFFAALCLSACASRLPDFIDAPDKNTLQHALSGELILGHSYQADELPDAPLFALTPEMIEFAHRFTADVHNDFAKADALHRALLLPVTDGGRGITYSALHTVTGAQTFADRRANCLSFTLLYVSLAREIGLDARVNEVELPPTWDIRNSDAFLFFRHVNAKVLLRHDTVVIDLEMERYSPTYRQKYISDELAAAQYYSNRGMDFSAATDMPQAFLYLRKALQMNDEQSYIWNNMATIYRRLGYYPEAESLYLQGLVLNPQDYSIISNLSGLYKQMGETGKAKKLFALAERHRNSNPYYIYYQAMKAFDLGNIEEAEMLLQQALRREKKEVRFYQLGEKIYQASGDDKKVKEMRSRMQKLTGQ